MRTVQWIPILLVIVYANCADSWDEDSKLSGWPSPLVRRLIGTTRSPPIRRSVTSIELKNCTAPPQPENGHWKLDSRLCIDEQDCNVPEGTELVSASLIYSCNQGYKMSGLHYISCITGKWMDFFGKSILPICIEIRCKALDTRSVSMTVDCKYKNDSISCKSPVPIGTNGVLICKNNYHSTSKSLVSQRNNVTCQEYGLWEPDPMRCFPVCGTLSFDVNPTIGGDFQANFTEFSWHATMYLDEFGKKKFICGASIIQENLLITAAHCVYNENNKQLYKPSRIYILTGNIFRNYDDPSHNPELVHRNQVKRIYISRHYLGYGGNFSRNIAILELVTPFVLSATLMPICIDNVNGRSVLDLESFGKVAGFGKTASNECSSVLQALTVPADTFNQCSSTSQNAETQRHYTSDQFCAGFANGASVCAGDGGSGLIFKTNNLWYLRGIVSISLDSKKEDGTISYDNSYTLYTDIFNYMSWIQTVIVLIEHNRTHLLCSESSETKCS